MTELHEKTAFLELVRHDVPMTADGSIQKSEFSDGTYVICDFAEQIYEIGYGVMKRKAPHVDFVLIKIQDFVVFPCTFLRAYLALKAEICYIIHVEVFMPGAKKMPERDETK